MMDNNAQGRQHGQPGEQSADSQNWLANYQFTEDEIRVIKECEKESFFYRSLPIGTGLGMLTYTAVQKGYLKPNKKYGAVPKIVLAAVFGYFAGKLSYQTICAEKLMQLPNSRVGQALRERKQAGRSKFYEGLTPDQGFGSGLAMAPFQSASDLYSDEKQRSTSLNLDTERPSYSGLDDSFRPSIGGSLTHANLDEELNIQTPKNEVTYDEIRKRNRQNYADQNQNNPFYQPLAPNESQVVIRANERRAAEQKAAEAGQPGPPPGPKNIYGDTWSQ